MNRRRFLAVSAFAGINPGPLSRALLAEPLNNSRRHAPSKMSWLKTLVSAPVMGFPTVTPTFAAMFTPGAGGIQLVESDNWADFVAQTQAQSNNGYVLSAMTSIQNLNRTWYYGAYQQGTGSYQLYQTADSNAFQQMFSALENGYTLVDFNVAWQQGQVMYSGYWLAASKPAGQAAIWDVDAGDFATQVTAMGKNGMVLTRIQAYPQNAATVHSAIFAPGTAGTLVTVAADTFFTDVGGKYKADSLVDIAWDPTSGNMSGYYGSKVTPSQFVSNQEWATLAATAQQAAANGMVLTSMAAYPNAPDFDDFFEANEAPYVKGYAYAVSRNGQVIANSGGFARSPNEKNNPSKPYTPTTRQNIASSSKVVTGVALQVLIQQNPSITLESPFWPLIQSMVPNPDPSIKVVTLRQLADMKSGLMPNPGDGPLSPPAPYSDIWGYLNAYLAQPLTGTPGTTYNYNNTNFTILQGTIAQVSGMEYVNYVTKYVFEPAGIDTSIYNATPEAGDIATLGYSSASDTRPGFYPGAQSFVAAGGWITDVREMIKLLIALRGTTLLPQSVVSETLTDLIGWDGVYTTGSFGTYYYKNGGIDDGVTPPQWVGSATVRLGEGYDCVLLANSGQPVQTTQTAAGTEASQLNIIFQVINAFESRGVPIGSEPSSAPSLTTVVHGASFLPNCAPGGYASIIGSGFPSPAVNWDPSTTLPTELNGVKVLVGGEYAYIAYAGPTQINFLIPSTVPSGQLQNIELTMPAGGMQSSVQINAVAPGLFTYQLNGKNYPAALIANTATVVAAAGALSGSTSRPAVAGDMIELYGTGMGATNPAAPDGVVFSEPYPAESLSAFAVTIGGIAATVSFAGLVGPGLFQINVQIPSVLAAGDQPVTLTVSKIAAQSNLVLTIGG